MPAVLSRTARCGVGDGGTLACPVPIEVGVDTAQQ